MKFENINVKPEVIKEHLLAFSNSLKNYPDKYLHRFYIDTKNPPEHFAYLCPLCLMNGIILEKIIGLGIHENFPSPQSLPITTIIIKLPAGDSVVSTLLPVYANVFFIPHRVSPCTTIIIKLPAGGLCG